MDSLSNVTINNHDPVNPSVTLDLEQNRKNDDTVEMKESNEKDPSLVSEKKPIKSILFVDDDEPVQNLFKMALEKFGYKVMIASDGNEAISQFREEPADLIITDIFMPKKDGHDFIYEIIHEFPETKIFAITGKNTIIGIETELDIAKTLGAIRGFTKPIKLSELIGAIKEL